jgi:hypothetical protein
MGIIIKDNKNASINPALVLLTLLYWLYADYFMILPAGTILLSNYLCHISFQGFLRRFNDPANLLITMIENHSRYQLNI